MRSNPHVIKFSRNRNKEGQSQSIQKPVRTLIWRVSPPSRLPGHVGGAGAAPQRQPHCCTMRQVTAQNSKELVVSPTAFKSVSLFLKKSGDQWDPAHLLSSFSLLIWRLWGRTRFQPYSVVGRIQFLWLSNRVPVSFLAVSLELLSALETARIPSSWPPSPAESATEEHFHVEAPSAPNLWLPPSLQSARENLLLFKALI